MNQEATYPIDKIIVMTLERTPNRMWAWLGASSIMQIPHDIIYFALGEDNLDYANNSQAAADAAKIDGFPFVEEYIENMGIENEKKGIQQTCATVCQIWNYCKILRHLIEKDETALIIFDDKMLTIEFDQFCQLTNEVQNVEKEDFYALQLILRGHPSELNLPDIDSSQRTRTSFEIFSGVFGRGTDQYKDLFLQPAISGYDETIVWSPEGADWMLKCLNMAPDFYHYLDHFICYAMPEFAKQVTKRNKGVYCPRELGYKFADVFMQMGTTTDWATEKSPMYQGSRLEIQPQYLYGTPAKSPAKKVKQNKKTLQTQLERIIQ